MESLIAGLSAIYASLQNIDWGAFFLWWLGIERTLRAISKLTPWKWDDDLVNWVSNLIPKKKNG